MASTSVSSIGTITVPLTTIYTPPSWCDDRLYTYYEEISGTRHFVRDASGPGNGRTSSCYPPDFGAFHTGISHGIYSPGICPLGWHASSITHTSKSPSVSWSMCCPSHFSPTLFEDTGWSCQSTVTTPTTVALNADEFLKVTTPIVVAEWPIFAAWQSSDLDQFTPASAPLLTAATATADTTTSFSNSGARPSAPAQTLRAGSISAGENAGLQRSAQAGLGVGITFACLAILAVVAFWWIRRKRARRSRQGIPIETDLKQSASEMDVFLVSKRHEAATPEGLNRVSQPAELPTDWQGHEL